MRKTVTEFQKVKRLHARMNPKNSPAMKSRTNKIHKEKK